MASILTRENFQIVKHVRRVSTAPVTSGEQSALVAQTFKSRLITNNPSWVRVYDLAPTIPSHGYNRPYSQAVGDAYVSIYNWAADDHRRQISLGMCCYTISPPAELFGEEGQGIDYDMLSFDIIGDKYLWYGCQVAVFFTDSQVPPPFQDFYNKIKLHPESETHGAGFYSGTLNLGTGSEARYVRTETICATKEQGIVERGKNGACEPETQPIRINLQSWGIAKDNCHYFHIMLFLDDKQYEEENAGSWYEGGALVSTNMLTLTLKPAENTFQPPTWTKPLCNIAVDEPIGETDPQGRVFSLVKHFGLSAAECATFRKDGAEFCNWDSLLATCKGRKFIEASYGLGKYPPVTEQGFDFYVRDGEGNEFVRIGSVDENFADFDSKTPAPALYSLVVGLPVDPGKGTLNVSGLVFRQGIEINPCATVKLVVYKGERVPLASADETYSSVVAAMNPVEFFNGESTKLVLAGGTTEKTQNLFADGSSESSGSSSSSEQPAPSYDNPNVMPLTMLHCGYHNSFMPNEEIYFENYVDFEKQSHLIIGVMVADYTQEGQIEDWDDTKAPGYQSQFTQLVEWPLNGGVELLLGNN